MLLRLLLFASMAAVTAVRLNVTFSSGSPVVLAGTKVVMVCQSWPNAILNSTWHWLRQQQEMWTWVGSSNVLTLEHTKTEDSGSYACKLMLNHSRQWFSQVVNLTVIECLSAVSVEAMPNSLFVYEGQTLTLRCLPIAEHTVSSAVVWSWERLGQNGSERAGSGQELTLSTVAQSGEYRCQANLSMWGIQQVQRSQKHTVFIVPQPDLPGEVSVLDVVAFTLVLLAWVILLLVVGYLYLQWSKANGDPNRTDTSHPTGPSELGTTSKMTHRDMTGAEIYMNCKPLTEAYCDLNPSKMVEDNVYGKLA